MEVQMFGLVDWSGRKHNCGLSCQWVGGVDFGIRLIATCITRAIEKLLLESSSDNSKIL